MSHYWIMNKDSTLIQDWLPPNGKHGGYGWLPSEVGTAHHRSAHTLLSFAAKYPSNVGNSGVSTRKDIQQPPHRHKRLMRCKLYVLAEASGI